MRKPGRLFGSGSAGGRPASLTSCRCRWTLQSIHDTPIIRQKYSWGSTKSGSAYPKVPNRTKTY